MPDKNEIAKWLAEAHFRIEPGIIHIYMLQDRPECEALPDTPIKLLEVNADTSPSGILPLHFAPDYGRGIPFPSVIVEVTPDEYEQIKVQTLKLPDGWTIGAELLKDAH